MEDFPTITQEDAIRVERNRLLKLSDWTQMPDNQLSDSKKEEWRVYRQKLRDLLQSKTRAFPATPSK